MFHRMLDFVNPPLKKYKSKRRVRMNPNPHYVNMIINLSIVGILIYVAIQVS